MKFVKIVDIKSIIIAIIIPLIVGGLSAVLSGNFSSQYTDMIKPPLSPPASVFPIVWTILYILMGISSYIIWENYKQTGVGRGALTIYAIQLALNFLWSIVFFRFDLYFVALIILLLLIGFIVAMIISFGQISPSAAALQIPYLLWCIFAAYLNYSFWVLNG